MIVFIFLSTKGSKFGSYFAVDRLAFLSVFRHSTDGSQALPQNDFVYMHILGRSCGSLKVKFQQKNVTKYIGLCLILVQPLLRDCGFSHGPKIQYIWQVQISFRHVHYTVVSLDITIRTHHVLALVMLHAALVVAVATLLAKHSFVVL